MAEAERYEYLCLLERTGHISGLTMQVEFELISKLKKEDGKHERAVKYKADFVYTQDSKKIIEDVKGFITKDYIIKRKLMLEKHGITIREIKK